MFRRPEVLQKLLSQLESTEDPNIVHIHLDSTTFVFFCSAFGNLRAELSFGWISWVSDRQNPTDFTSVPNLMLKEPHLTGHKKRQLDNYVLSPNIES